MYNFIDRLLQFFLPPQCYFCGSFLDEGKRDICPDCLYKVREIEPPFCSFCGIPFASMKVETHICGACMTKKQYFTMARAFGLYEGTLEEAIHRWKYQEKTYLSSLFGRWMADIFPNYWESKMIDLLIPVPLHKERLRKRGFNQSLLLVKELSYRLGIPYHERILRKIRPTTPQVNLSSREREMAVKGVFKIFREEELKGKAILLVDDVYTTGATVNECSKVLMREGAKRVDVFTLARAVKTI